MIAARVIADSISPEGNRLTTFVLTYPRFIHSEFMTHRVMSRNAASSRAIPAKKIRKQVINDPAMPVFWGANQKGMQADYELFGWKIAAAMFVWRFAALLMVGCNFILERIGLHKQIANRILEPWFYMTTIVSATDWTNFYALRNDEAAQPEIKALAEEMLYAHNLSKPKLVRQGSWHLPFVEASELEEFGRDISIKLSVARCARVSYLNHEGKRSSLEEDMKLYERLLGRSPIHASPAEHQATPLGSSERSANFKGWVQYRKLLQNENITKYPGLLIP